MSWSPKQEVALGAVLDWIQNGSQQVFRLFGYAGTGKTTLAKHLAETAGGQVLFAAFTGKAASVLRSKGCHDATTIHKLIYKPVPKSDVRLMELKGKLLELDEANPDHNEQIVSIRSEMVDIEEDLKRPSFVLNYDSDVKDADLVIIDECSMVGEEMAIDLLSFQTKVLVLGDPAQLPPVRSTGYFTNAHPDVLLTEIHRQAKDNPIIQLATAIRENGSCELGTYGESMVVTPDTFDRSSVLSFDQILVGRNVTRTKCNRRARELLGRTSHLPEKEDRLVCLRNNHDLGLLNGELWDTLDRVSLSSDVIELQLASECGERELSCDAHAQIFEDRELEYWDRLSAQEFDYGYALTTHKAQGSQWEKVVVFDESSCFRGDARKWLYTAVTRASEAVTLVTSRL